MLGRRTRVRIYEPFVVRCCRDQRAEADDAHFSLEDNNAVRPRWSNNKPLCSVSNCQAVLLSAMTQSHSFPRVLHKRDVTW